MRSESNRLAVYVSSFDGCSDLWDVFFMIFKIYWKDCRFPIYLVNNEMAFEEKGITILHTGIEKNWFDRTIKSLEKIDQEYILFLLEDYFISKNVSNADIQEIVNFMEDNNVFYYQLSKSKCNISGEMRHQINGGTNYPVSLQPAIWNRAQLLKFLYKINQLTPWHFEIALNEEYKNYKGIIEGVYYDTRDILGYKNGVLRGKWFPKTLSFYRKRGILIETGKREKLSLGVQLKYYLAVWMSEHLSSGFKEEFKKILKIVKFDYTK